MSTQPWQDQQLATTAGADAEYDDGGGGRSLQDEDLSLIVCEIPTAGCKNGMYNVKKCVCEVGCCFSTFWGRGGKGWRRLANIRSGRRADCWRLHA